MEVRFPPELEAKLTRYFDEESRFVEAVKRGEDALERGEYLTHDQVGQRMERFLALLMEVRSSQPVRIS